MIEHRSIFNLVQNSQPYGYRRGARVLSPLAYTFDPFVINVFGTLFCGATLVTGRRELVLVDIGRAAKNLQTNVVHCTPNPCGRSSWLPSVNSHFLPSRLNPAPIPDRPLFHLVRTPSTSALNGAAPLPPSIPPPTPTFLVQQRPKSPNPLIFTAYQPQQEVPAVPTHPMDPQPTRAGSEQ